MAVCRLASLYQHGSWCGLQGAFVDDCRLRELGSCAFQLILVVHRLNVRKKLLLLIGFSLIEVRP
jgi:hypothetical protein